VTSDEAVLEQAGSLLADKEDFLEKIGMLKSNMSLPVEMSAKEVL